MSDLKHDGRVVLVTGASRGIGYHAALEISRQGGQAIALARTEGALEELDDAAADLPGGITLVPMDLRKPEGLSQLADIVTKRWSRLDGLIGNAGILGALTPLSQIAPNVWAETFTVNLHANWALIQAFEPLLKESESGRAVFVTSGAAASQRAYWGAYSTSKAALNAMIGCWAKELEPTRARANLFNPGPVATAMRAQAMPGEDPSTLPGPDGAGRALADMVAADYGENGAEIDFRDIAERYST